MMMELHQNGSAVTVGASPPHILRVGTRNAIHRQHAPTPSPHSPHPALVHAFPRGQPKPDNSTRTPKPALSGPGWCAVVHQASDEAIAIRAIQERAG